MHKLIFKTSLALLTISSFLEAAPLPPHCPPTTATQSVLQAFCALQNPDPTWNCPGEAAKLTFSGSVTSSGVSCLFKCVTRSFSSSLSYSVMCSSAGVKSD